MIRIQHKEHGFHNVTQTELEAHLQNGWTVIPDASEKEPVQPVVTDIRRPKLALPKKAG